MELGKIFYKDLKMEEKLYKVTSNYIYFKKTKTNNLKDTVVHLGRLLFIHLVNSQNCFAMLKKNKMNKPNFISLKLLLLHK